jgi:hypothetical protein
VPRERPGGFCRKQVKVKQAAVAQAGNCAVGAYERYAKAKRLRHGKGKRVPPAGNERNLDSAFMSMAQYRKVGVRDLMIGIQQGSIDVDGDKPNRLHSA